MPGDEAKIRREKMLNAYCFLPVETFALRIFKASIHDISHLLLCA
jgi:hypothetical protein